MPEAYSIALGDSFHAIDDYLIFGND